MPSRRSEYGCVGGVVAGRTWVARRTPGRFVRRATPVGMVRWALGYRTAVQRTGTPDRTIALCKWSGEQLRAAGCSPSALSVIPPAVEDTGPLSGTDEERAALGVGADDFVVTYCGNLDAYQNLPVLLRAIA